MCLAGWEVSTQTGLDPAIDLREVICGDKQRVELRYKVTIFKFGVCHQFEEL